ncbi:MAG: pro-sigmaK processing inhibitor BofA family protein [Firmicutes bacterium]|nr:pro-sigmaK processing inhibitor BofA family protein [Bacillota bacterium]
MDIEMGVFLTFGGALILILLLGRVLLIPLKLLGKLVLNSILGAVIVMVINFVGMSFGLVIPLNIINAVIVGVLGIPGAIMLLILCY